MALKKKKIVAKSTVGGLGRGAEGRGSKGAVVRSCPPAMSAQDVVALAKDDGIEMTVNTVHNVRSADRAAKQKAKTRFPASAASKNGPLHSRKELT